MYGAYRPVDDDKYYWRVAQFLFPFYTLIPTGALGVQINVRAWVPVDDEHTMFWNMAVPSTRTPAGSRPNSNRNGESFAGTRLGPQFLPNTTGWLGRWRLSAKESNEYLIDREVQRTESYTGIEGIHLQDQAITESMGPIYDRTQENLGTSDAMIVRTRRRLIRSAVAHREGTTPPGVDNPELYRQRSGGIILPRDADWIESTEELRKAFTENPELSTAV